MNKNSNLIDEQNFEYDLRDIESAAENGNETAVYLREALAVPARSIAREMSGRVKKMDAHDLLAEIQGLLTDWRITHPRDALVDRAAAAVDAIRDGL